MKMEGNDTINANKEANMFDCAYDEEDGLWKMVKHLDIIKKELVYNFIA
jgi:hypothetical protein